MCILADEQRHSYREELAELDRPGVEFLFEDSPEQAIDLVGQCNPDVVLVGMTVGMMDGLEVLALLMQKHQDFAGKIVVLPDKGDPFPPMLQYRDPVSGKSTTESLDLAGVESLIRNLAPARPTAAAAPAPTPTEAVAARKKAPAIPLRAKPPLGARPRAEQQSAKPPVAAAPVVAAPVVAAPVVAAPPSPAVVAPPPSPAVVTAPPSPAAADKAPGPIARGGDGAKDLAALVEQTLAEPPAPAPPMAVVAPPTAHVEPIPVAHEVAPVRDERKRPRVLLFAALALGTFVLTILALFAVLRSGSSAHETESAAPPVAKTTAKSSRPVATASAPRPAPATPPPATAEPKTAEQDLSELTPLPLAFSKRSADYSVADRSQLDALTSKISGALDKAPRARLEVGGHSSEEGAEWLNHELSERRATAVRDYLAKQGIPPERMVLKSYGSSVPSKTSSTDPDSDRRVTVRLLESGTEGEP